MELYKVQVGPRFFETLGIPLLAGRAIGPKDMPDSPAVAVVNKAFAATYLPNVNPLGKRFSLGSMFLAPGLQIVGVVGDSKYYDPRDQPKPMAFLSAWQVNDWSAGDLLLRTRASDSSVIHEVKRALSSIDPKLAIHQVSTVDAQVERQLRQQELLTNLCGLFAFIALLLASIGVYGTISYSVARRTIEIGIRMAIGAQHRQVLWMVAREAVILTAISLCAGVPAALLAFRSIGSLLFGIPAADPLAIATAVFLVILVAFTAGYLPAWRASRIDPMRALKYE
jgi:predicted permease